MDFYVDLPKAGIKFLHKGIKIIIYIYKVCRGEKTPGFMLRFL